MNAAYLVNDKPVDADSFYAVACDPCRSVAVEACAGAGKTWMLISRIVKALEQGAQPDEILAITFTRKAAGEMRQRLQEALSLPEHNALRLQLLASGRNVQISTFHAWFGQLLGAAPLATLLDLGLPLQYELLEDEGSFLPELRLAFYDVVAKNPALKALMASLMIEHGRKKIDDAFTNLLAKRTEFELTDIQGLLENSVQNAIDIYPAYANALTSNLDRDWLQAKPKAFESLQLITKNFGKYNLTSLKQAATSLEMALAESDLDHVINALLTKEHKARVFSKTLTDIDRSLLGQAQVYLLEILAVKHQHACWLYQQSMTRLGRVWLQAFAKLKQQRKLVDMTDLERIATTLLSNSQLSGAIQERLDLKLRHVMMDEFQDTNPLQWQAMHAWLSGYAGSGGGMERLSLFIVGDPKQSIYRFRRAEPRVFAAAQAFMQKGFDAALLSCDHTRRNAQAVLSVVNTVMQKAQENGEYANFRAHTAHSASVGAALCLPFIVRDREAAKLKKSQLSTERRNHLTTPLVNAEESLKQREAKQAASWIASLPKQQAVMVLARKHDALDLMQQALQAYDVIATKQEKNFLVNAPAVQDVIALLSVLVSPQNDLDLAHALKTPLFAWSDKCLMDLRAQQLAALPDKKSWFDLLPIDLKAKLARWQAWLQKLPPHDALQAIYDDGEVLVRYPPKYHQTLQALLWAALEMSGGRFLSAYAFVRAMRSRVQTMKAPPRATEDTSNIVQLLTIHGAKGLEADVVLLLDSDSEPRKSQSMTTLIDWQPEHEAPRKFVFLQSESAPPICAETLLIDELKAREIEELNTLYVACTRARQTLIVSATEASNANPKSVWQRLSALCDLVAITAAESTIAEGVFLTQDAAQTMKALPDAVPTLPALTWDAPLKTNEAAQIGQALHRLLQWLPVDDGTALRDWQTYELIAVQREFKLSSQAVEQAYQMAQSIANGEAAWLWDIHHIDWQANEYELTFNGQMLRIDRLIKRRDTQDWWVVDFKSTAHPEASATLRQQLCDYVQAVSALLGVSQNTIKGVFVTRYGRLILQ